MATIELPGGGIVLRLTALERAAALRRSDVVVDRGHVVSALRVDDLWGSLRGLRWPGTGVPGLVAIGTWRWRGPSGAGRDFVLVRGHGPGVVVELSGHEFDRLLLTTDEPEQLTAGL